MLLHRAIPCLALISIVGCSSSSNDAGGAPDAKCSVDACCCDGDVVEDPDCSSGAPVCAHYQLHFGSDCITKCQLPGPIDSGHADTNDASDANDTKANDANEAGSDADTNETNACADWDADWGDVAKPDVMTPCRSACDCPSGMHCCAAAFGTTCAPAFECP